MIKKRIILTLFLVCINVICFAANIHSFTIETMEGAKKKIDVSYRMGSEGLAISCSTDRIYLDSYSATKSIEVLKHKFLKITYSDLGGTNIESEKTVILTVIKDKIIICAYFTTFYKVDSINKISLSQTKLKLNIENNKGYILIANSNEYVGDTTDVSNSAGKLDTLTFDRKNYVFRTGYKYLSKRFNVYDPKTDEQIRLLVTGKIPVIDLLGFKFDYIYGQWYQEDTKGNLYKCTFR